MLIGAAAASVGEEPIAVDPPRQRQFVVDELQILILQIQSEKVKLKKKKKK